jgi:acetylornithine deacetylase/succinyl-diaminopimelate desuccinylase-like protein
MPRYEAFDRYVEARLAAWTDELVAFCRIPSEASNRTALADAAGWIAERLRRLGARVEVFERDDAAPLVIGEIGSGRTLLAVQHYDVQPAAPHELWTTPAYDPQVRGGRLFARGANDNKGELLARVWAAEAYLATIGELPCRVRFLVEGEEEGGGANLGPFLDAQPWIREADGALIEGGDIDLAGRPRITCGVRGMASLKLTVRTIAYDAHSSVANLVPNAAVRMVKALATLWDDAGLPAVAGLDEGVRLPTPAQLAVLAEVPDTDVDDLLGVYGIEQFLGGRQGPAALRALTFDPTLNIQGLWSGYTGPGGNTITPAEANARLDIRLVPDQQPETVERAIRRHLDDRGFGDVEVSVFDYQYPAWWTPPDDPIVKAAIRVSEAVLGKPAVVELSGPGTAPMSVICADRDLPTTSLGGTDDEGRAHAPDESIRLDHAAAAVRMTGRFLDEFAAIPPGIGAAR